MIIRPVRTVGMATDEALDFVGKSAREVARQSKMAMTLLVVAVREPNLDGGTTPRSEPAHLPLRCLWGDAGRVSSMFVDIRGLAQSGDDFTPDCKSDGRKPASS